MPVTGTCVYQLLSQMYASYWPKCMPVAGTNIGQ